MRSLQKRSLRSTPMPRKSSNKLKRAAVAVEFITMNEMTYPEIRDKLEKDLADPNSPISRYLQKEFGYRAGEETGRARVMSPEPWRWRRKLSGHPEDPKIEEEKKRREAMAAAQTQWEPIDPSKYEGENEEGFENDLE
jgi:hypothetical protein